MKAMVQLKSKEPFVGVPASFCIGGYAFRVGDVDIHFDFYETAAYVANEEGHLLLQAEVSAFDDDTYASEWDELGYTVDNLTAEWLSSATEISEIHYECYADEHGNDFVPLALVSFEFDDGEKEYAVNQEAVDSYNNLDEEQETVPFLFE